MGKKGRMWCQRIDSIRSKILCISLVIASGTTILSLLISYYAQIEIVRSITEDHMTSYITAADHSFNEMIEEAKQISLSIAVEKEIIYPILMDVASEASYKRYQQSKQIRSFFTGLMTNKDYIEDILLVTQEKQIFQAGEELFLKRELENEWMKGLLGAEKVELRYHPEGNRVFLSRPIVQKGLGRVVNLIRLDYEVLTGVYRTDVLENSAILIFTSDEELFFGSGFHGGEEKEILARIKESEYDSGYVKWNQEKYYFIRYFSGESQMITIGLIPYREFLKEADRMRSVFFTIGLFVCTLSFLFSYVFSDRLCKNLRCLTAVMDEVREGKLEVRACIHSNDEISRMADTFNEMMDRIRELMDQIKEKERLKLEAEQTVLSTQIEPHFLYNTIDSIQYVAHMKGEWEIERVANALSRLLRSVLDNKDESITLWEEREYIENYMAIERFKRRNKFELVWEVDEELWGWHIPKLLLQPIVENALIHGISDKGEDGTIQVKVFRQGGEIICRVMDNGKGMSRQETEELQDVIKNAGGAGFRRVGIANVFGRIKLIYGEPYGGSLDSCENMFTCVELRLPG